MTTSLKTTFHVAVMQSLPILSGFLFLGAAYGVYMRSLGFDAIYPILMAVFIFAGSVEFIMAGLLLTAFNPLYTFLLILMISTRQTLYGISMLEKFQTMTGWKRAYLISAMTDESFAINYNLQTSPQVHREWCMVFITLLLHFYWVSGTAIGALLSDMIPFRLEGSSFAMTALFLVIFLEQWLKEHSHESSIIGLIIPLMALLVIGQEHFLIPALIGILAYLTYRKTSLSQKYGITK